MPSVAGNSVLRAGGFLIKDPTDLGGTYPEYGGTNLGAVTAVAAMRNALYGPVVSEERNEVVEQLYLGESWTFSAVLRQYHQDVLTTVFPNTAGSGSSTSVDGRGSFRPGQLLSDNAVKLLWVPHDVANHPAILVYKALPAPESLGLAFSVMREHAYLVNFVAMPDASSRTVRMGLLSGLAL